MNRLRYQGNACACHHPFRLYAHKKRQQDAVNEDEGLLLQLLEKSTHSIRSMAHGE